jgi:hypothetical protein
MGSPRPLLLLLLPLVSCASPAPVVSHERIVALKEVEEGAVGSCTMVGRFEGDSAQQGERAMTQAREEARAKAVVAGATHVVIYKEWQSPDAAVAVVNAYTCAAAR